MSTELVRARSISYNDIKKKRMLRESKSKPKLHNMEPAHLISGTQRKCNPSRVDEYAYQRPNEVDPFCQKATPSSTSKIVKQPTQVRDTVKRKNENYYIDSLESRIMKSTANGQKDTAQVITCEKSRQVVRQLIAESKSQRRLLRFQQLRNKFKLSKSRSRSKSTTSLAQKSRMLAKRLTDIQTTPQKPQDKGLKGIKNSHRIKRFESVKQDGAANRSHFRYLVNIPRDENAQKQLFKGIKKQKVKIEPEMESSIQIVKESSLFGSQDDKFLEQIELRPRKPEQKGIENKVIHCDQNILDLLDVEHRQLSRAIEKKQREKKILKDLSKLNKKFPIDFFKF